MMEFSDLVVPGIKPGWLRGRNPYEGYARALSLRAATEGKLGCIDSDADVHLVWATLARTVGKTAVPDVNIVNLFLLMKLFVPRLAGDSPITVAEFGVHRGGSLLFLASLARAILPNAHVVGFDTFCGFSESGIDPAIDHHKIGDFVMDDMQIEDLRFEANEFGNVSIVKGEFRQTAYQTLKGMPPVALCHIDADTRDGVGSAIDASEPYMMSGGYWVLDDPLQPTCLGAMEAVEDLLVRARGLNCEQSWPHLVFRAP